MLSSSQYFGKYQSSPSDNSAKRCLDTSQFFSNLIQWNQQILTDDIEINHFIESEKFFYSFLYYFTIFIFRLSITLKNLALILARIFERFQFAIKVYTNYFLFVQLLIFYLFKFVKYLNFKIIFNYLLKNILKFKIKKLIYFKSNIINYI